MSEHWPDVTVLIVTWDRPQVARATIRALHEHLKYSGVIRWHLADDQSPGTYVADIEADFPELDFTHTITPRLGWGANVNAAFSFIETPYCFLCEDDYIAKRDMNIDQGVALIESHRDIAMVRYDGIAGHALNLELREARPGKPGNFAYCRILKHSPFLNVYSNRPHLVHKRFHQYYGVYTEGLPLGQTEENFAKRVYDDKGNGPDVAILANGIELGFDHVGHSRQGSEADKESSKQ